MIWVACLCAQTAFLSFGLATDAHYQRRFGHRPDKPRQQVMRRAGWTLLLLSFALTLLARGAVLGPVLWIGLIMLCAGISFLALNFLPHSQERKS